MTREELEERILELPELTSVRGHDRVENSLPLRRQGDDRPPAIERVFSEIESPAAGGDWQAELRKRAVSTREALLRHRWAVGEMEGRTSHGPSNMKVHDAILGCLRAAGFSIEMTVHAMSVQDAYIYGFALQQTDMSSQTAEDFAAEAQRQMVAYADALADYPNLVEVVGGYVAKVGYDYDREFLFGLDVILDGLERCRTVGVGER